jgi:hypothetical protein
MQLAPSPSQLILEEGIYGNQESSEKEIEQHEEVRLKEIFESQIFPVLGKER